jgi:hypothetical protein
MYTIHISYEKALNFVGTVHWYYRYYSTMLSLLLIIIITNILLYFINKLYYIKINNIRLILK